MSPKRRFLRRRWHRRMKKNRNAITSAAIPTHTRTVIVIVTGELPRVAKNPVGDVAAAAAEVDDGSASED